MLTGSAYLPAASHPSPRPRLMNEACSPCYRSLEDISKLLSTDLFTPSASRLHPFPLFQQALKFQSLLSFPSFYTPDPSSIHLPKWIGAPANLCPPEQKRVLRIVPVMGKGAHMLNVTHNGRPVWGPKAVNDTLHHAALRCHASGIQWHHWESMLLPWSSEPQQQRGPC